MKRQTIADILSLLLLVFFVHTLVTSYINRISLQSMLGFYTIHAGNLSWIILMVELLIAGLLFAPATRRAGFLLTILFALTAIIVIYRTPHYPHDFGGISNIVSHQQRLVLYITLIIVAIAGWLLHTRSPRVETRQAIYT